MTIDFNTEPDKLYVPNYLNAIGYTSEEGGQFKPWIAEWGIVQSHRMPRGINDSLGNIRLICTSLHIYHKGNNSLVHCVLFEKGYMWDTINGWRNSKLEEHVLDEIKSRWLFSS